MKKFFEGFPLERASDGDAVGSMVASLSAYYPDGVKSFDLDLNIARLIAKAPTIAAFSYKKNDRPAVHVPAQRPVLLRELPAHDVRGAGGAVSPSSRPSTERSTCCSSCTPITSRTARTSTVRMVGSSQANLFASISAGICALWGPLHGGANQAVIEMLERIRADGGDYQKFVDMAKDKDVGLPPDGLRPPRLQELRSAREDPEEDGGRGAGGAGRRATRCSTSPRRSRRSPCTTTTSSPASSTRTSTSTAASSTGRWASPPTCSR